MSDDLIGYNDMVENAMLDVVRQAVDSAAENGLPGNHHFYITFKTRHAGVNIPDQLHKRYPDEMTIVLQHQFWNLSTLDDAINVDLSFNQKLEHLCIPLAALVTFADPSVNFGLQFNGGSSLDAVEAPVPPKPGPAPKKKKAISRKGAAANKKSEAKTPQDDNVVTLDAFRKK